MNEAEMVACKIIGCHRYAQRGRQHERTVKQSKVSNLNECVLGVVILVRVMVLNEVNVK